MSEEPVAPDPWKSFRGVMAGTLILEAIVVLLALPVVAASDSGLTALSGTYLIGLAVVMILLAVYGPGGAAVDKRRFAEPSGAAHPERAGSGKSRRMAPPANPV